MPLEKTELCNVLVSWSPAATEFQEGNIFLQKENKTVGKVSPDADSLLRIKIIACFFSAHSLTVVDLPCSGLGVSEA